MKQEQNKVAIKDAIAVILTDAERRIQWVNDDFTTITGYAFEEVVGKKPSLLQGKNTSMEAIETIRDGLKERCSFKAEITNYRKNGEEYLCRLVIHPIYNYEDVLTNFIAFEVDGNYTDDKHLNLLQVREKYRASNFQQLKEIELFAKLTALLEKERLFLKPDLKMSELAERLHLSAKYLSQVVHNQTDNNIVYYVNTFRVNEAKRKIVNEQFHHLTTYGIAQTCGFKNKSTFYKVFKEITNMTPKEYIQMVQQ